MNTHSSLGSFANKPVAVVTGASSGIGEVFARRLAAQQQPLLLVARRLDRLEQLAAQLKVDHGAEVDIYQSDLAEAGQLNELATHLRGIPNVGYLINNAGFGYMGDFADLPLHKHLAMLDVHVTAVVKLTHAVLPKMIEANQGTLINVSSMAAWTVGPGQAMYNATKAFVKTFTESLHAEVEGTNVRIQALCPGITHTGFHDTDEFSSFDKSEMPNLWMSADEVVEWSLSALDGNRAVCVPGFKNRVLTTLFRFDTLRRAAGKSVRKQSGAAES
jgi:short-subunit dehydrogenase